MTDFQDWWSDYSPRSLAGYPEAKEAWKACQASAKGTVSDAAEIKLLHERCVELEWERDSLNAALGYARDNIDALKAQAGEPVRNRLAEEYEKGLSICEAEYRKLQGEYDRLAEALETEKRFTARCAELERERDALAIVVNAMHNEALKAQTGEPVAMRLQNGYISLIGTTEVPLGSRLYLHPTTERRVIPEDVRKVMEMALEALELTQMTYEDTFNQPVREAITALRNALNAAPKGEV